ncbi:MAG: UvrD-helicase domain-containing protein [Spirochaetales bacterium]|nr:UvrD-helicase domain-containing protein [Spirochaetales bacterium]MCF7938202.1 UvrD-helicase domain-containing protein [Spirochaetales bacterium]
MTNYLDVLNDAQLEAVLHEGGPLLILAGAGSGKTRVITTKIAYLIDRRAIDPRSILAVTFTNKAAREMKERAASVVPSASGVMIRTFHSFGAWLLRRNAALLGMDSRFSIYDDDDSRNLLASVYEDMPRSRLKTYTRAISRAKDYCLGPEDDLSVISHDPQFPEVYRNYEQRLRATGCADFGDLIMQPVKLLSEHSEVRQRITDRFKVVLVDEYQDSNVAQYELLQRMYRNGSTYLCVVGDDDQSIYRFRGAEVRNILTFPENFPGTRVVKLEQNYRSTASILSIASSVVANNTGRLGKTLWTENDEGFPAQINELEDQNAEARFCARRLSPGSYKETAVLYRTNAQSRSFETVFTRMGIPYRLVGTVGFYEREEIKDSLAYLALLANPRDEIAFRRVVNKPARGVGKVSLERIFGQAVSSGKDLVDAAADASRFLRGKARSGALAFAALIRDAEGQFGEGPLSGLIEYLVRESGLVDHHRGRDEAERSSRVANIEELVNAAQDYTADDEGLTTFLEDITLDRSLMEEDERGEGDRVTLITMHNTKGLEFDRVIITGMEEGLFPRSGDDPDELEEERRLFYVAITRARKELVFTYCNRRRIWGRSMYFGPSSFLRELPQELVRFAGPGGGLTVSAGPTSGGDNPEAEYPVGSGVYHDSYGTGQVVGNHFVEGQERLRVRFETGKVCVFLAKYTPLERISLEGM